MRDRSQRIAGAECSVRFTDGERKVGQVQGMLRAVIHLDIFAASGIRIGEQLVNDDFSWEDRFEFIWDRRLFWTLRGLVGIVRIFRLFFYLRVRINCSGCSSRNGGRKQPSPFRQLPRSQHHTASLLSYSRQHPTTVTSHHCRSMPETFQAG